jgi:ribosomal protein S18 acetylase RimI-like enzyme
MKSEFFLKSATRKHKEEIKQLYKQEKEHIGSFNLYKTWDNYFDLKFANKISYYFLVVLDANCYHDSNVLAFVRVGNSKKLGCWTVYEIAVSESHKRKGIARFILDSLPKPLALKCNDDNEAGNKFYERIGMTKVGKTKTRKGIPQNIWQW